MIYAALLIAAVTFARHAPPKERQPAFLLAIVVLADWVVCGLTYEPYFIHRALGLKAVEVWAICDGVLAMSAVLAALNMDKSKWVGWIVWELATVQIILHLAYSWSLLTSEWLSQENYTGSLSRCLDGMIICFLLVGGRGVADNISRAGSSAIRWIRGMARPAKRILAKVQTP